MNDVQTPALREAVENMRNMRESYDVLSRKMTTPLEWTNEEQAVQDVKDITSRIYIIAS